MNPPATEPQGRVAEVFLIFLRLGCTAFGGPVAHIGFFRDELVQRRRWLSEAAYADLVALCQFLPGPASSQVGMALGLLRAGRLGLLAAWLGFTLPSALAMVALGLGLVQATQWLATPVLTGLLQGLAAAAVAVVAQAVWGMARTLCPDTRRRWLMLAAAATTLALPSVWTPVGVVLAGAAAGLTLLPRPAPATRAEPWGLAVSQRSAWVCLALAAMGLLILPWWAQAAPHSLLALADSFYRAGALVFGGGHVVLPLLEAELVRPGGMDAGTFLAGYGLVQAMPGPLFTVAAYLGAVAPNAQGLPLGAWGGVLALVAVFVPGALLLLGTLPFWDRLRQHPPAQAALMGTNAAVVGLLLAALWNPVIQHGVLGWPHAALALLAWLALSRWQQPAWAVVLGSALAGAVALG
jgi:chromate transporter